MKSPSAVRLQSLYSGLSSCWAQVPSRFLWSWMGGCVAALWARACQWQALSAPGRRHRSPRCPPRRPALPPANLLQDSAPLRSALVDVLGQGFLCSLPCRHPRACFW